MSLEELEIYILQAVNLTSRGFKILGVSEIAGDITLVVETESDTEAENLVIASNLL